MHERVHRFIQQIRTMREEVNRKLDALKHQVVLRFTSEDAFERPQKKYHDLPKAVEYIGSLQQDIVENFTLFLPPNRRLPRSLSSSLRDRIKPGHLLTVLGFRKTPRIQ